MLPTAGLDDWVYLRISTEWLEKANVLESQFDFCISRKFAVGKVWWHFFRKQKNLPKLNRINLISTYRDAALDIEFFYSLAVTRVGILNCGFYFLESSKRVEKLFFKISTPSRPWSRAQTFEHFFWLFHFCRRVLFLVFIAKRFCMFIFVSRKVLNFQKPWTTNLDQQNKRVDFQFRKRHFLMTPHGPERGLSSELFLRVFVSALKFLTFSIWYFRKKDLKVM